MQKILFVLIALLFAPTAVHAQLRSDTILDLINTERARGGLTAVAENPKLNAAAQLKADDMAAHGYFEHIGPDGKDPWSWFAIVDYKWEWAGEILAMNANTESETAIVDAWMNSPSHKKIIMDSRYTEVGFGIAVGEYEGQRVVFVAGEFGVPKASAVAPAPTPAPTPSSQQTVMQTQPVQTTIPAVQASVVQTVAKVTAKPIEAVVKKAEAKEVVHVTTTTSIESASSTALRTVEHPVIAKASLITRIKLFFSRIFTFPLGRVG